MKQITLVLKDSLEHLPPISSLCKHLNDLGFTLSVICDSISDALKEDFTARGIKLTILPATAKIPTKLGTIYRWMQFRRNAWKAIHENPADIYWIGSADTALALGHDLLKLPYIFHVHELYDAVPMYRNRLAIYMRNAKKIFVPEEVRAHIFRAWYQLKETPIVLPNKPYGHPRKRDLPITDPAAAEAFEKIPKGAKILFYQGLISKDRDISWIVDAVKAFNGRVVLAVQGQVLDQEYYQKLRSSNCFFIPFMPAPKHLEITSHMDIGLLTYEHIHQNNEFCAPNKIWEYTGFGLPILANDVFALKQTIAQYDIGFTLNLEQISKEEVQEKIQFLLDHAEDYTEKTARFFDSVKNNEIIKKSLSEID